MGLRLFVNIFMVYVLPYYSRGNDVKNTSILFVHLFIVLKTETARPSVHFKTY